MGKAISTIIMGNYIWENGITISSFVEKFSGRTIKKTARECISINREIGLMVVKALLLSNSLGEWYENMKQGKGTFYYSDGTIFRGNYIANVISICRKLQEFKKAWFSNFNYARWDDL
jgi:MORN repeat.